MDVSIIIVNWNTRDILRDCLKSVYTRTEDIIFEVIVVDNASSDGSADMIRREFPPVRLIENTENKGFAAANNQGMRIAQGRYVLLLNSDTIVLDDAIQRAVRFADGHLEAGVVGCRTLNADRSLQITCFMFPSVLNLVLWITYLYKVFPRSRFWGRARMTWWDRDDAREVDVVTGCFMLVRRDAIDRVGLMDEQFFMYAEEADWCYRFCQAGYKRLFTPEAQIIHLGGASSDQIKPRMIAAWRKSTLLYFKKHTSLLSQGAAWTLLSLFYLTRVPYWVAKAAVGRMWSHRPEGPMETVPQDPCEEDGT
ncbi:MAG: glycosyltransferase family 2 protein [Sedimentisphaerales bacterium]|nr:glycosyltransferase family 2 protein [Sedimentisphaerales bacterium]